jgi:colanic acid biosynthesis glycosyl transferase WcaI
MGPERDRTGVTRPPKVVFVNRYFYPDQSATSRIVSDLAFRLAERGLTVAVITSRQLYENPDAGLSPHDVLRGVTIHRIPTATLGRARLVGRALDYASFHAIASYKLARLLAPGDVVVAETDPPLISVALSPVARWHGALLINWLQDIFPEVASALTPGILPKWIERLLVSMRDHSLHHAAMNVVLSDGMGERLRARGIDTTRTRVIPNWADTISLVPRSPAESFTRRKLGLQKQFVVGYSGNFGRAHEFETLLKAALLLREDSGFTFLMTGNGAKVQELRRAVGEAKLASFVFQDYQPAEFLADNMSAANIHVVSLLPALEGLIVPSKVYGILAVGRPVLFIGHPQGDLAGMIRNHDCGIALAVGESERLAAELHALREDPPRLESMGRNARRLALERYTSEQAVGAWLTLLETVAPATVRRTDSKLKYAR